MKRFVFVHGFTGSSQSFAGLVAELSESAECGGGRASSCAFELHGHGQRPDLAAQSFEQEVQRLRAFIVDHCAEPPVLVGYSMGARLSLGLLAAFPGLVQEAVLISVNPGVRSSEERSARRAWEEGHREMLDSEGLAAFITRWEKQGLFATQRQLAPHAAQEQRRIRMSHSASGLASALRVLGLGCMPSYWDELSSISARVAVMCGDLDQKFVNITQEILAKVPHWRLDRVPRVGHNLILEAPDRVLRVLLETQRPGGPR